MWMEKGARSLEHLVQLLLGLLSSCKRAKCLVNVSIDGLGRSYLCLLLLLYLEKSSEAVGMPFFFVLPASVGMPAGQSQAVIPSDQTVCRWVGWAEISGGSLSCTEMQRSPCLVRQHFLPLQLGLGQGKSKLSLWAVLANSLLLSTADHDFTFNYLH